MEESHKCAFCGASGPSLTCGGCKTVSYCSTEHQKKHWKIHRELCRPFKISCMPNVGRFLEAVRDLPEDSFILNEMPIVVGPSMVEVTNDTTLPITTCVGCFVSIPVVGSSRCPKCHWPACRSDCPGLEYEKLHRLECPLLSFGRAVNTESIEVFLDFYRIDSLLVLKCLALQVPKPKKWELLMKMESHEKERKSKQFYQEIDARVVSYLIHNFLDPIRIFELKTGTKILPYYDQELLHKICGVIEINAIMIPVPNGQDVAAIYPTFSIMEHSCAPNCVITFGTRDGFKILANSGKNIVKGEHLTTSYVSSMWTTQMRRDHLRRVKHFSCTCQRCQDKTEFKTFFSALRCLGAGEISCGGSQLPIDPLDEDSEWVCINCPIRLSANQVSYIVSQMNEEVEKLLFDKDTSVKDIESLMEKLTPFLHKNHSLLVQLKCQLVQFLGHKETHANAKLTDDMLRDKARICHDLLNVLSKLDPYGTRLAVYFGMLKYELAFTEIELIDRLMAVFNRPQDSKNASMAVATVQEHITSGIGSLKNETQTPEGKDLIEKFNQLSSLLQSISNKIAS